MEALTEEDPRSVGGYELRARLGAGGFGEVYLGLSPGGRAVAVKMLRPELGEDRDFLRRFHLEVAAAQRVNGLYTAHVVAVGLNERRPWVATAFVPGPSLDRAVAANGPLPEPALWRLLAGLVEALQAIHACDLVHRDLKPENVLLAADGPRVIDFGISKSLDGTSMTATGMIIGTPSFMAPEQADGQVVGPESDIFSLGCVLAYAATGATPFGGGSHAAVLYRVVYKEPELDGVPPQLRAVIERCLAKAPEARPALEELAKIGRDGPVGASAQSPLAFWPPQIGQLIREYEGKLDDVQLDDAHLDDVLNTRDPDQDPSRPSLTVPDSAAPTPLPGETGGHHQPGEDGAVVRRRGRRWLPAAIAGLGALAAVVVAAAMLNPNGGTSVPQLRGDSQAQAVARIEAAGLKPAVLRQIDSHMGSGLVISTKPANGSSVKKGETVTVYLSAGPGVPVVRGLTWPQAQSRIEAAGFVPVAKKEASPAVKAGGVIGTQPASGDSVPAHGQVTVDVSTGPASLTLPNIEGLPATTARARLQHLGFSKVKLVTDPKSAARKGEVDWMTPAPGRRRPSQQITLYTSVGGLTVPRVIDDTEAEAVATLEQHGFTVQTKSVAAPANLMIRPGGVYSQNPGAGVTEPKGAVIQILVEPRRRATPRRPRTPIINIPILGIL
jgi:beta-lactam-binding protein with PASTA domain/serine/threonine protein kinase